MTDGIWLLVFGGIIWLALFSGILRLNLKNPDSILHSQRPWAKIFFILAILALSFLVANIITSMIMLALIFL